MPKDLVALMSAVKKETRAVGGDSDHLVNTFEQKVPIPSYLIAIVVGALESRLEKTFLLNHEMWQKIIPLCFRNRDYKILFKRYEIK